MKTNKKFLGALLALAMLISVFAVTAINTSAADTPASEVEVSFTCNNIHGISGEFEIVSANGAEVEVLSFESVGTLPMQLIDAGTQKFYSIVDQNKADCRLVLKLKLSGTYGAKTDVVIRYNYLDDPEADEKHAVKTVTLFVVDYSALEQAIEAASKLDKLAYTDDSWAGVETALAAAQAILYKAGNQAEVDAAAAALNAAIAALVELKLDFSELQKAIDEAKALVANEYTAESWLGVDGALKDAEAALTSRDQEVIDAAATALKDAMAALVEHEAETVIVEIPGETETVIVEVPGETETVIVEVPGETETVIVEVPGETETVIVEVPGETETVLVEVPGEVKSPVLWIVLFVVFLVLTLGLAALIVVYMILKKKKESDDTPVVDYNIEDDVIDNK